MLTTLGLVSLLINRKHFERAEEICEAGLADAEYVLQPCHKVTQKFFAYREMILRHLQKPDQPKSASEFGQMNHRRLKVRRDSDPVFVIDPERVFKASMLRRLPTGVTRMAETPDSEFLSKLRKYLHEEEKSSGLSMDKDFANQIAGPIEVLRNEATAYTDPVTVENIEELIAF